MRAKRDKALKKTEKLMAKDSIVWMSDERSASEGESTGDSVNRSLSTGGDKPSVERPGNAQYLETPSVIMPIDFSGISSESLFGKKKEVYRLKPTKLDGLVDCQLCKLIFDSVEDKDSEKSYHSFYMAVIGHKQPFHRLSAVRLKQH